jgi:capsular polysaccharide transport system permease protein
MKRSSWQIQKAVVFALLMRELKTRFGGRMVGLLWMVAEPMINIAILLALKVLLRERFAGVMIDIAVYLVVAMVPFFIFRNIWTRSMSAVDGNAGLFSYRQVKPADAIASRALMEITLYTLVFFGFLAVFAWLDFQVFPVHPLEYMGIVLMFITTGIGIGLLSAVVNKFIPGTDTFIRLTAFPLYITSGVLIPIHHFPPLVIKILLWNPLLHIVEYSRWAYFPTYNPLMGINLVYPSLWMFGLLFVGVMAFWVHRRRLLVRR